MNLVTATQSIRAKRWPGYLLAVILIVLALWLRLRIGETLDGYPFLIFLPAVVIVAFVGGFGPGMLAAILSGLLAKYYLIEPFGSLLLIWPSGWIAMGFYAFTTIIIVVLTHGMFVAHAAQIRTEAELHALNLQLEDRVAERTAALQAEVTERAQVEAQLRQMQKMESIGQLTGGIAHDFNNMLAIVIGSLDMAKRRLVGSEHPKILQCIDNASQGAQRAATLTARLLAFSRQQPLAPQAVQANQLVSGMSELLRRTIGEHIRVETILAGGLWHAFADPSQLESAILNLAVNARDAMPDGGKLTIETANTELDDRYARSHAEVEPGQYVMICVSDSGTGMPPEVIERAFDPFYTTKGVGKGTGLGLSQVFGYVKQSGGHVKIYSEIDRGTTVKIYLPRHLGAAGSSPEPDKAREELPTGAAEEIILVVEDEDQVRHMTVDALRELGYTIVQASDANQALEQLAVQPQLDLVFTDIVMPGMSGRELADKVRAQRPEIAVLFTTGYTRNAVVHNGMLDAGVAFLPKPFTIAQLAWKVREVLDGGGANRP
ncbi:MAG: ATP-binding protein [Pseudomonadota bacterium]|jgi:signal transduction histidine kinase|uniref:Putative two-component sensor histidine kinase n=1 Tax=hydrothermal vent metagenome TaxID=652676 RepID=A0A170PQ44_9ZZZZ